MTKMKTHKASRKRFKVTATGKLKRSQAGKKHLNSPKPRKRKRQLAAAWWRKAAWRRSTCITLSVDAACGLAANNAKRQACGSFAIMQEVGVWFGHAAARR